MTSTVSVIGQAFSPSGSTYWNSMTGGTTLNTRIGWQVKMSKAVFRIILEGASDYYDAIRLFVVLWKETPPGVGLGTSPGIGDFLDNVSITNEMIAPYKWQHRKYFRVLYDKVHIVGNNGNSVKPFGAIPYKQILLRFKLNRNVLFASNTLGGYITNNALQVYATSNSVGIPHPAIIASCRITYQDS